MPNSGAFTAILALSCVLCFIAGTAVLFAFTRFTNLFRPRRVSSTHQGLIDGIRDTGDLVALEAHYKDVGAHKGEAGWFVGEKKLLLICTFEMQFRFNLRKARLQRRGDRTVLLLPPCQIKTLYKDVEFYDEQAGKTLQWLPVVRDVLPHSNFSLEERNHFISKAKDNAKTTARKSDETLLSKAEYNAEKTLKQLFSLLGVGDEIDIEVSPSAEAMREEEDQIPSPVSST